MYAPYFNQIYQRFHKTAASFIHVYLREAHASDEWPVGNRVQFRQHQTQEERIRCAEKCRGDLSVELPGVVDHIDNDFNNAYASWPERFYIIHEGRMAFIAYPQEAVYDPFEVVSWLEQYVESHGIKVDAP